jgi:hypothetical protein
MNVWVPLVLAVMPMSVSIGQLLLVVAALSATSAAGLYAGRRDFSARPTDRAVAGINPTARNDASIDAALHASRARALVVLYGAVRNERRPWAAKANGLGAWPASFSAAAE